MNPRRTVVVVSGGLATVETPRRWGDDPADEIRAFVEDFEEYPKSFGVALECWSEHPSYPGVRINHEFFWGFPAIDLYRELRARGMTAYLVVERELAGKWCSPCADEILCYTSVQNYRRKRK